MLNHRRLLSDVTCLLLSLFVSAAVLNHSVDPSADTTIASRYHQRQHSSTVSGRFGFRSHRINSVNHHPYRQHIDRPNPVGPHYLRPQEKIATRPANGVQS